MVAELEHKESTDNDSYDSYDMFSEKEKKTSKPHVTTIQEYTTSPLPPIREERSSIWCAK